ncbi:hypothetical protein CMO90_02495 [Candidatus Woesearchaeota archaeon]|jgi:uncharacterized membrane protein YidH (DUF202 family)|nr:hypothetical protein [Candidatus Woesearchaeota archaeon]|tara:strand:+ start:172 stop:462 length:291 start_codon:yes stop_codon:yes gene_type:complete
MKKELSKLTKLAEERNILAKERTLYSEERTFLSITRTIVAIIGIFVFVFKILIKNEFWADFTIILFMILGIIIAVERLHTFHKKKEELKTLEERLE